MKLKNGTYYCLILLLAIFCCVGSSCRKNERALPSMSPPYKFKDKGPMGTSICYELLHTQFDASIQLASRTIKGQLNPLTYMKGTSYVCIGKSLSLDDEELQHLLEYVERGNEFFLAADVFDYRLMDTLGIRYSHPVAIPFDSLSGQRDTYSMMADTHYFGKKHYGFYFEPMLDYFSSFDSGYAKVLGVNERNEPNYIVLKYGKGKFYFHLAPAAFTNYFLLTGENTNYYTNVFSYLNHDATAVYWGDVSRFSSSTRDFSSLSMFWNNPPLLGALLLFCALMLLYIAFGSKRRRRIVPVAVPNKNESLSFVHTIGNLYLQKKDNRGIAIKMINHFFEHLRTQHYIPTHTLNDEFVQALSRKTGVEEQRARELVGMTEYVNTVDQLTDQELFNLNNLIYEFYKNR
jgi:hypothetical protein